ncbi:hypothetical protein KAS14_01735 [Candidatus Bathyarchaeota archaeon]|nr:hypothetical protein [Candidatus Bathyarchaeota archaeon]
MPKRKKRREIKVDTPTFTPKDEALLKDTTGIEALSDFKVSQKIGKRLSSLMIMVGALFSALSVYSILTSAKFLFSNPLFTGILGFLGAINTFCGLILLAKE